MRETYTTLHQTTQDFCIDDKTSTQNGLSASSTFIDRQVNDTVQYLFNQIRNHKTQPLPKTFSTVASQIYYHFPPELIDIESVTISVGSINYPLRPINSQAEWDKLQQLDITSSDVPQYYFPRQYDFGVWPTPNAVYTGTLVANYLPKRLSVADYTTGTVTTAQNDATITGASTAFTAVMAGRWFALADANGLATGRWYKIASFTSTTAIELESVFEETTSTAANYVIGESPEIPEELQQYIPYRAAATYYATLRRDPQHAQTLLNYFFTGDFNNTQRGGGIKGGILGVINRYKLTGRSNSQLNTLHKGTFNHWRNEAWATTLS